MGLFWLPVLQVQKIYFIDSIIRKIRKPERRIMTVEDPVEYEVAGINQTQVNSEIGLILPVLCVNFKARPGCYHGWGNS